MSSNARSVHGLDQDHHSPRSNELPRRLPKRQRIVTHYQDTSNQQRRQPSPPSQQTAPRRASIPSAWSARTPALAAQAPQFSPSASSTSSLSATPISAVPKRRFTRSRAGCSTCRKRKVKCDETQPQCLRCIEDGRTCQGYASHPAHQSSSKLTSQSHTQHLQQLAPPASRSDSPPKVPEQVSHPRHDAQQQSQLRPRSTSIRSSVGLPSTTYYDASPQHLDDWIDLLCASIGNNIPTTNDAAKPIQAGQASTCRPYVMEGSNFDMPHRSARSDEEQRLSTLASTALGASQASVPLPADFDSHSWLNKDWPPILTDSPADSERGSSGRTQSSPSSAARHRAHGFQRISEPDLQSRLRALCVTKVQLESVSFFFNTTARCFHLLSADTNVWRFFFAQLASESPMILDLIACLGLTHLSLTQDHRKKALAHAHFSRCKTEWDSCIGSLETSESLAVAAANIDTAHRVLEVLAGTILIAHIEQFSRGFATSSRASTALAITVIRKALETGVHPLTAAPWLVNLDRGPASAFRFFARILLWWETMSRTMGPASERGNVLDIFQHVYRWDEADEGTQDPIECSTQCVVGWPLELLEAVERTNLLSTDPEILAFEPPLASSVPLVEPSGTLSHAFEGRISLALQQQIDAVETQIRLARPLPLVQDDTIAAELRYLIFECLQSASLVYFCRVLLKSTDAVWFEIDKVTRFLERKQQRALRRVDSSQNAKDSSTSLASAGDDSGRDGPTSGDPHLTQAMESRGNWWVRAPDGALIWAYFQCASEIFGALDSSAKVLTHHEQDEQIKINQDGATTLALGCQLTLENDVYRDFAQSRSERRQRCRESLQLWEKFDEIQDIFLCRHLLKAIWDRRDLYELRTQRFSTRDASKHQGSIPVGPLAMRYDQAAELDDICRQRRWRQPLIF